MFFNKARQPLQHSVLKLINIWIVVLTMGVTYTACNIGSDSNHAKSQELMDSFNKINDRLKASFDSLYIDTIHSIKASRGRREMKKANTR